SRVFSATGDSVPTVLEEFTLPGQSGRNGMQRLEVAPDGTLYVIDSLLGRVFRLDNGQPVLHGQVPADRWGGLMGNLVPGYYGLSVGFDTGDNVYGAYVYGDVPEGGNVPTTVHSYSVFFPREPVSFTGVALFTRSD